VENTKGEPHSGQGRGASPLGTAEPKKFYLDADAVVFSPPAAGATARPSIPQELLDGAQKPDLALI
jgi:hypothetical protein